MSSVTTPGAPRTRAPVEAITVRGADGGVRVATAPDGRPPGASLTIQRAGVCGTDLQIAARVRGDRARVLGHEALAVTGSGRPVVLNPVGVHDQDSILGHSYDGVFRRRCRVPHPDAGGPTLVAADTEVIADLAPLTEPLAAAIYGWELVERTGPPARVAVWGGGFLGLACATLARLRGAEAVVLCSGAGRAAWARRHLGLHAETVPPPDGPVPVVDAAFLCVPRTSAAEALDQACGAVASDGVIDLVGGVPAGVTVGTDPAVPAAELRRGHVRGVSSVAEGADRVRRRDGRWLRVTGHRGTSDEHLGQAQALLAAHPEWFAPMVTHVVSLRQAAGMINRICVAGARTDPGGDEIVKIVIDPAQREDRRDVDPAVRVAHLGAAPWP